MDLNQIHFQIVLRYFRKNIAKITILWSLDIAMAIQPFGFPTITNFTKFGLSVLLGLSQ